METFHAYTFHYEPFGIKDLNFKFNLGLISLNINSHMWLLATIPGSTDLQSPLEAMCSKRHSYRIDAPLGRCMEVNCP